MLWEVGVPGECGHPRSLSRAGKGICLVKVVFLRQVFYWEIGMSRGMWMFWEVGMFWECVSVGKWGGWSWVVEWLVLGSGVVYKAPGNGTSAQEIIACDPMS